MDGNPPLQDPETASQVFLGHKSQRVVTAAGHPNEDTSHEVIPSWGPPTQSHGAAGSAWPCVLSPACRLPQGCSELRPRHRPLPTCGRGPSGDGASIEGRERRGDGEETHLSPAFSSRGPTHVSQTGSDITALLTWVEEFRWFVRCCQGERHSRPNWRLGTGPRTPPEVPAVPAVGVSGRVTAAPAPAPTREPCLLRCFRTGRR